MSESASLPVPSGTVLAGKYKVGELLASGGMGVVASGEHLSLSQRVAIKFLRTWTPEGVARFRREARACAKLSGDHIVRVIDVDALENGMPFMVMELLEGVDLSEVLKERKHLSITETVEYVLQACKALAEAHRNGIIHRDLKPANLFLTHRPDGSPLVKVLDFGISKIRTSDDSNPSDDFTTTNTLIGSPSYMSPEQLRAARHVDERTDIWALGAVLYKLISGRNPFVAESTPDLCIQVLTEDPPAITEVDVPDELFAVIRRCLEKERDKRYRDVGDLALALRPWSSGNTVESIVGTLGGVRPALVRRTPNPSEAPTRPDSPQATTVDPSVRDTTRPAPQWRVPVAVFAVAGAALGGWLFLHHPRVDSAVGSQPPPPAVVTSPTPPVEVAPATVTLPPVEVVTSIVKTTTAPVTTTVVRSHSGVAQATKNTERLPYLTMSVPTATSSSSAAPPPTATTKVDEFGRFGGQK